MSQTHTPESLLPIFQHQNEILLERGPEKFETRAYFRLTTTKEKLMRIVTERIIPIDHIPFIPSHNDRVPSVNLFAPILQMIRFENSTPITISWPKNIVLRNTIPTTAGVYSLIDISLHGMDEQSTPSEIAQQGESSHASPFTFREGSYLAIFLGNEGIPRNTGILLLGTKANRVDQSGDKSPDLAIYLMNRDGIPCIEFRPYTEAIGAGIFLPTCAHRQRLN